MRAWFRKQDASQLYRWLGEGEPGVAQFTQAAVQRMPAGTRPSGGAADATASSPVRATRARRATRGAPGRRAVSPVEIEGIGDLPVTLARCCSPVRPQQVVGYVTLGRGVTVHASGCAGLRRMQATRPERVLRASWTEADDVRLPVELTVSAYDRRGLIRDLSEVLAAQDVDVESLHTTTDRSDGIARTGMRLRVRDLEQMTKVLRLLAAVPDVISARRSG